MLMPDNGARGKPSGAIEDVAVTIDEDCRELGQKGIVLRDSFFSEPVSAQAQRRSGMRRSK